MPRSNPSPTAYDVARMAGVSQTTVSLVVNGHLGKDGKPRISENTRQRVLAAMKEIGYVPNDSARSLRRRRTDRICLVLGRLGSPYYEVLADDVQRIGASCGYSMVISVATSPAVSQQITEQLTRHLADGVIIGARDVNAEMVSSLVASNLAVVVLNDHMDPAGFDVVRTTRADAFYRAMRLFLDQGHRRIAFLDHTRQEATPNLRKQSYTRALRERGIPLDPELVKDGAESREVAFYSAVQLLHLEERPTAVFAASDIAAISTMWAVRDAGLRVPEDVAVIGVGNIPEGTITRPALTTVGPVSMDFSDVVELLLSRLAGEAPERGRVVVREWDLIHRGSA